MLAEIEDSIELIDVASNPFWSPVQTHLDYSRQLLEQTYYTRDLSQVPVTEEEHEKLEKDDALRRSRGEALRAAAVGDWTKHTVTHWLHWGLIRILDNLLRPF